MVKPLRDLTEAELDVEAALVLGDLRILRSAVGMRYGIAPPSAEAAPDPSVKPFRLHAIACGVASLVHDAAFMRLVAAPIRDNWRRVHARAGLDVAGDPQLALLQANVRVDLEALVLVCIDSSAQPLGADRA